jgi:hypothetical protein
LFLKRLDYREAGDVVRVAGVSLDDGDQLGDGSMYYAITVLWSAANYDIPVTMVVASNAESGIARNPDCSPRTPTASRWWRCAVRYLPAMFGGNIPLWR